MQEESKGWTIFWFLKNNNNNKVLLSSITFDGSYTGNMIKSCAHLFPAPLHEQVDGVWGQTGLQEPQA